MIRSLVPFALGACLALSACSQDTDSDATTSPTPEAAAPVLDQDLPFDTMPDIPGGKGGWEECPYLDSQFVADTNGQRMVSIGVDHRFDTPACVFWSYEEQPQATVLVRHMQTPEDAKAVVDWAAPIDTTNPANDPEGWSGGRIGNEDGAVYAVQKENIAVVVWSDQAQSVKAEGLAVEAISRLSL